MGVFFIDIFSLCKQSLPGMHYCASLCSALLDLIMSMPASWLLAVEVLCSGNVYGHIRTSTELQQYTLMATL